MMFNKLGILNAFSTYDIFNLGWVYWDVTLSVTKDLYANMLAYEGWDKDRRGLWYKL